MSSEYPPRFVPATLRRLSREDAALAKTAGGLIVVLTEEFVLT